MIDIEKIRKAYSRFQGFSDEFAFKAVEREVSSTNMKNEKIIEKKWEVVRAARTILTSTEEECKRVAAKLNSHAQEILQEEYDLMMNSMKEAEVIESSN